MIGKIIGAVAGSKVAERVSGVNGPMGAVAGIATAGLLRRMSLPAMIAIGAGGYFAKKFYDRKLSDKALDASVTASPPISKKPSKQHPLPA